jgi:5-aminolevulinate synthase
MRLKYKNIMKKYLNNLKLSGQYRDFKYMYRPIKKYPQVSINNKNILICCSNDYLNMTHNLEVIKEVNKSINKYGVGSGGTRNISGSHKYHNHLENKMKSIHKGKDSLIFTSCYNANLGLFSIIKKIIPDAKIFSDEDNHASIINGIKYNNLNKCIFKHNCMDNLQVKLEKPFSSSKIIIVESVYSMNGDVAPLKKIINLAKKYKALVIVDEVHSIGLYGNGRGLVDELGLNNEVDIITGTYGKAIGLQGGYVSGCPEFIDLIRNTCPEFIFTTSTNPSNCKGIIKSLNILTSVEGDNMRKLLFDNIEYLRNGLDKLNINYYKSGYNKNTHITCIIIGDSYNCKNISEILLKEHKIYIQPIIYPTVKSSGSLLRITLSNSHSKKDIDNLLNALKKVFLQYKTM